MEDSIKELLWDLPHINFVSFESGEYCLIVVGTTLNDFVEDHLWDDFEYFKTAVTMETPSSIPVYYNYLPADLPVTTFIEALNQLDPIEVERVSRLNS